MCMSDDPWSFSCIREVVIGGTSGESFCVDGLLLVFFDIQHLVTLMCVGCIASSLDHDCFLVRLSLVGLAWSPDFVILGGTHMESRFCHFVFRCGVHSSGRIWCILSCVWLSGCWLCDHLGWGDRLSTPRAHRRLLRQPRLLRRKRDCTPALFLTSSLCTPALSLCSSEEEGLAPLPSSSQWQGVLWRRRDRPSSSRIRRVLRRGRDRPSSPHCRYVRRLLVDCAVQVVRGHERVGC